MVILVCGTSLGVLFFAFMALRPLQCFHANDLEAIRKTCDAKDKARLRAMLRSLPSEAAKRRALLRILPLYPDNEIILDVFSKEELLISPYVKTHLKYYFPTDLLEDLSLGKPADEFLLARRETANYVPVKMNTAFQKFADKRTGQKFVINWVEKYWAMLFFDRHAGLISEDFGDILYNGGFANLYYFQRALPAEIPEDLYQDVPNVKKFCCLVQDALPGKFSSNSKQIYAHLVKMQKGEEYLTDFLLDDEGHAMLALITKEDESSFEVKIFDSHEDQFEHHLDQNPGSLHKDPYYGYSGLDYLQVLKLLKGEKRVTAKLLRTPKFPKAERSKFQVTGVCTLRRMMRFAKFYLGMQDYMVFKTLKMLKFLHDLSSSPEQVFTAEKHGELGVYGTASPIKHLWLMIQRTPFLESRLIKQLQRLPNADLVLKLSNMIFESVLARHPNLKSKEEADKFVNWENHFIGIEEAINSKPEDYSKSYNGGSSSSSRSRGTGIGGGGSGSNSNGEKSSSSSPSPLSTLVQPPKMVVAARVEFSNASASFFMPSVSTIFLSLLLVSQQLIV